MGSHALQHVTLRSGDGGGRRGLDLVPQTGPARLHHITVSGFDTGIFVPPSQVDIEHVILSRQNKGGIVSYATVASFRNVHSRNAVPALVSLGKGRTLLDGGDLSGGSDAMAAILNPSGDGHGADLRVRNVRTRGYPNAISDRGENIPGVDVTEYASQGNPRPTS